MFDEWTDGQRERVEDGWIHWTERIKVKAKCCSRYDSFTNDFFLLDSNDSVFLNESLK